MVRTSSGRSSHCAASVGTRCPSPHGSRGGRRWQWRQTRRALRYGIAQRRSSAPDRAAHQLGSGVPRHLLLPPRRRLRLTVWTVRRPLKTVAVLPVAEAASRDRAVGKDDIAAVALAVAAAHVTAMKFAV